MDYLGLTVLVVIVLGGGWTTRRAWRSERRPVKWLGATFAGLVTLAALAVLGAALVGYRKLTRRFDNPPSALTVDATPERLARGEQFAGMCAGCHAGDEEPPLEGRDFLAEEGAPPIGTVWAPNLTPIHLGDWSDGEIIRAIREGIHRSGRALVVMPSATLRHLSDEDVVSLVAYLRSQPSVEPDSPPRRFSVLGAVLASFAPIFENQRPITSPIVAPPAGPTPEYGGYLVSIACTGCHGAELTGNPQFGSPGLNAAGLAWSDGDFERLFSTGAKPGGVAVDSVLMPWRPLGRLLEQDGILAVARHLRLRFGS